MKRSPTGLTGIRMFRTMFAAIGDADLLYGYPVLEGVFPDSVDAYDGYLVTGSAAGGHDDYDWLTR